MLVWYPGVWSNAVHVTPLIYKWFQLEVTEIFLLSVTKLNITKAWQIRSLVMMMREGDSGCTSDACINWKTDREKLLSHPDPVSPYVDFECRTWEAWSHTHIQINVFAWKSLTCSSRLPSIETIFAPRCLFRHLFTASKQAPQVMATWKTYQTQFELLVSLCASGSSVWRARRKTITDEDRVWSGWGWSGTIFLSK